MFEKDYSLQSLEDVEHYINEHKHLPGLPPAKEIEENGLNLGEMDALLLQKIEELMLYNIQQNKQIASQEKLINELKQEVENLRR